MDQMTKRMTERMDQRTKMRGSEWTSSLPEGFRALGSLAPLPPAPPPPPPPLEKEEAEKENPPPPRPRAIAADAAARLAARLAFGGSVEDQPWAATAAAWASSRLNLAASDSPIAGKAASALQLSTAAGWSKS